MYLVLLGWILLLMNPSAVELSVCIGVLGFFCPNTSRVIRMYAAYRASMYRAPSLASAADDMTFFMICEMVSMAPLFGGNTVLMDMKKWPPFRLRGYGLLRYPASLCVASFIWLRE